MCPELDIPLRARLRPPGRRSHSTFITMALVKNEAVLRVHTLQPCGVNRIETCARSDRDQASADNLVSSK